MRVRNFSFGFTLAEVLITLGIIGVVAVLTIPQVVRDYKDKASVTHLKKAYSVMGQAWQMATLKYGEFQDWGLVAGDEDILVDRIAPFFNAIKVCHIANLGDCMPDTMYLSSVGTSYNNWVQAHETWKRSALVLSNGVTIMMNIYPNKSTQETTVMQFYVDLNGKDKPNKLGDDFFYFYVTDKGRIYPAGHIATLEDGVDKQAYFETACLNAKGCTCANWVIENDNRDYLKCKDLSYYGKRKCK